MKPQQERLAELHQDYDSMTKFFQFVAKKTKDEEKRKDYEKYSLICQTMKEVVSALFKVSEELLGE